MVLIRMRAEGIDRNNAKRDMRNLKMAGIRTRVRAPKMTRTKVPVSGARMTWGTADMFWRGRGGGMAQPPESCAF